MFDPVVIAQRAEAVLEHEGAGMRGSKWVDEWKDIGEDDVRKLLDAQGES